MHVESQTVSPDQARSHAKHPSSHIVPENEDTMLVTEVLKSVLDKGKGRARMNKASINAVTSAPNAESNTIYVTSNTVSGKSVHEPTQPQFNGKFVKLNTQNTNHDVSTNRPDTLTIHNLTIQADSSLLDDGHIATAY